MNEQIFKAAYNSLLFAYWICMNDYFKGSNSISRRNEISMKSRHFPVNENEKKMFYLIF